MTTPLLRGRAADDARGALRRISRALLDLPPRERRDPTLDGNAGFALAHAALHPIFPRSGHLDLAETSLDRAIDGVGQRPLPPNLFNGFTGIAWAVEHLRGDPSDADDPNEAIDGALESYLSQGPWRREFDLVNGLAGFGVYALERLPRPSGRRLLELVVERLAESAKRRRPGLAWWSDPSWLPPPFRETPNPDFNLGVAHGIPAVVTVLAGSLRAGVAPAQARRLLEGAVTWMLAQEAPEPTEAGFPNAVGRGVTRDLARSAWCYGDPGLAAALLAAATAVGNDAWSRHALRIALRAAKRPAEGCGVRDAGFCHGAAGLGHLFHRMYLTTREPRLARAARSWLARALDLRREEDAIGGFASWSYTLRQRMEWAPRTGLVEGISGIALAFAAALGETEPGWDRVFAISLRPSS